MDADRDSRFDMILWQFTESIRRLFLRCLIRFGLGDELVIGEPTLLERIESELMSIDLSDRGW